MRGRFIPLMLLALVFGGVATSQDAGSSGNSTPAAPSVPEKAVEANGEQAATEAPPAEVKAEEGKAEEVEPAVLELVRSGQDGKERIIRVERATVGDDSGMFTTCGPQEGEAADAPSTVVFAESGARRVRITIDKNVIEVPVAIVTQTTRADGSSGDGRVEASAGTARFLDDVPEGATDRLSRCAVEVKPQPAPDTVFVTQGKTQLKGQKLVYDEVDGIARIDGPITFERVNDEEPLSGSSERIDVNVDEESTTLIGNVILNSKGGRVSKAPRVEYDDATNTARLYGTPEQAATSVKGSDTISLTQGYILYDLNTSNVVARAGESGNVTGEFQDSEAPSPAEQRN